MTTKHNWRIVDETKGVDAAADLHAPIFEEEVTPASRGDIMIVSESPVSPFS
jgi:hypothetical protein